MRHGYRTGSSRKFCVVRLTNSGQCASLRARFSGLEEASVPTSGSGVAVVSRVSDVEGELVGVVGVLLSTAICRVVWADRSALRAPELLERRGRGHDQ